eukprot:11051918-Alexandrium_andersonii.AAC.1
MRGAAPLSDPSCPLGPTPAEFHRSQAPRQSNPTWAGSTRAAPGVHPARSCATSRSRCEPRRSL